MAEQIAEPTADGKFKVNAKGVEELVADKGYHSGDALVSAREYEVRSYIAEPDRGRQKWAGKREQQAAVYANRQRIGGNRGKQLLRRRGELVERTFAHAYETGALRRLYVRGKQNVQKEAAATSGNGQPSAASPEDDRRGKSVRAMQDAVAHLLLVLLRLISALNALNRPARPLPAVISRRMPHRHRCPQQEPTGEKSTF